MFFFCLQKNDIMCNSLKIRKLYYRYSYISDNNEQTENKDMFQRSENNDSIPQSLNKGILSHGLRAPGLTYYKMQCKNRVSMLVTSGW